MVKEMRSFFRQEACGELFVDASCWAVSGAGRYLGFEIIKERVPQARERLDLFARLDESSMKS